MTNGVRYWVLGVWSSFFPQAGRPRYRNTAAPSAVIHLNSKTLKMGPALVKAAYAITGNIFLMQDGRWKMEYAEAQRAVI